MSSQLILLFGSLANAACIVYLVYLHYKNGNPAIGDTPMTWQIIMSLQILIGLSLLLHDFPIE